MTDGTALWAIFVLLCVLFVAHLVDVHWRARHPRVRIESWLAVPAEDDQPVAYRRTSVWS